MRKSVWLLGAALVVSLTTCLWLWSALRNERASHQLEIERLTRLSSASSLPSARPKREESASVGASPAPEESGANVPAREEPAADEDWMDEQRRLLKDPKYFEARLEERRAELVGWRDDAMRLLGFSRKDADTLVAAYAERYLRLLSREPENVDASPEGLQPAREAADADERAYQDHLRDLVGEEKRASWETFLESRFARRQVETLRTSLDRIDALRDEQIEPLVSALYRESAEHQRQKEEYLASLPAEDLTAELQLRYFERSRELLLEANRRKHSAGARILSSTQLKRFDEMLDAEVKEQEASQRAALVQSEIEARQPKAN